MIREGIADDEKDLTYIFIHHTGKKAHTMELYAYDVQLDVSSIEMWNKQHIQLTGVAITESMNLLNPED